MARMLGRSRSLRLLRGAPKESRQQEPGEHTPRHADEAFDFERLKAATPDTRPDRGVETPDMLQRPKTSGGLGDRGRLLFHRKVAPVTLEPENTTYNFPVASPTKSTTVLYTAEINEDREGYIGIALGSPTMARRWNSTPRSTDFVTNQTGTVTEITSQNTPPLSATSRYEAPKPKLSRWKSIFGKKTSPRQEKSSFYQLAQTITQSKAPIRQDSHHDDEDMSIISEPASQAELRTQSPRAQSPPTYKPDIRESRKTLKAPLPAVDRPRARTLEENKTGKPKATIIRTVSSPTTPPKFSAQGSPAVPQLVVSGGSQIASPSTTDAKPLLDVEIPSIQMERYSVMFGNLLQPNNRSSSLLVRRQGTERLKPLNELSMKRDEEASQHLKPQRRATSPSIRPKSPGVLLSLFPQPEKANRAPSPRAPSAHRPKPLQRSRTAPSNSPHRQSFPETVVESAKERSQGAQTSTTEDAGMRTQLLTPTPSSRTSFDSDLEEIQIVVDGESNFKARYDEPEWEIVSKPQRNAASYSEQPASAPVEPSRGKAQAVETAPQSAGAITTIGVARSVSVSRTQRPELLKPTLTRVATSGAERLVDKRALTPTLVELQNRKSQRVQLVDA